MKKLFDSMARFWCALGHNRVIFCPMINDYNFESLLVIFKPFCSEVIFKVKVKLSSSGPSLTLVTLSLLLILSIVIHIKL